MQQRWSLLTTKVAGKRRSERRGCALGNVNTRALSSGGVMGHTLGTTSLRRQCTYVLWGIEICVVGGHLLCRGVCCALSRALSKIDTSR